MERIPLAKLLPLALLVIVAPAAFMAAGCSSDVSVSKEDEDRFKHPKPPDMSKLPPDAFKPKGPAFIGQPTGATKPSGAKPPASVTGG